MLNFKYFILNTRLLSSIYLGNWQTFTVIPSARQIQSSRFLHNFIESSLSKCDVTKCEGSEIVWSMDEPRHKLTDTPGATHTNVQQLNWMRLGVVATCNHPQGIGCLLFSADALFDLFDTRAPVHVSAASQKLSTRLCDQLPAMALTQELTAPIYIPCNLRKLARRSLAA